MAFVIIRIFFNNIFKMNTCFTKFTGTCQNNTQIIIYLLIIRVKLKSFI